MLALTGIVYVICTSAGSSYAMTIMLKRETGDKMVGANQKNQTHKAWQKPMDLQMIDEICCGVKPDNLCPVCNSPMITGEQHPCRYGAIKET